ncbi:MAG: hypothetical protein ACOY3K_08765 [Candidatus Omnitrophota bacterium]
MPSEPSTAFLLAEWDGSIDLRDAGTILSLDPAVSHQLESRGSHFQTLEHFYDERDLRTKEGDYYHAQLRWFGQFDRFLQDHFSLCRQYHIPIATANYLRLKYCFDTIAVNAFIIRHLFEHFKSSGIREVRYVYRGGAEKTQRSIFHFEPQVAWVFGEILKCLCGSFGLHFRPQRLGPQEPPRIFSPAPMTPWKRMAKNIRNAFKFRKILRGKSMRQEIFFFMHAGGLDVDIPIREVIRRGAGVLVKEHGRIWQEHRLARPSMLPPTLEPGVLDTLSREASVAEKSLTADAEVMRQAAVLTGVDPSSTLLPFLKEFIGKDIPVILAEALQMRVLFLQEKVHYVLGRANTDPGSTAAFIAAKYMETARSCCLEHASFGLENELFQTSDTATYDITLPRDPLTTAFLKKYLAAHPEIPCRVQPSMHYLKWVERTAGSRIRLRKPGMIIYVPKKLLRLLRPFNNMPYPCTWYYEFQKAILDLFADRPSNRFIYKHAEAKTQRWAEDSILRYLQRKKASHIEVYRKELLRVLPMADRVITDYPSGAFFEAVAAGKAVLCLAADYLRVMPEARKVFGKSLRFFRTFDEAKKIVAEFLDADPDEYRVRFPLEEGDFVTALGKASAS